MEFESIVDIRRGVGIARKTGGGPWIDEETSRGCDPGTFSRRSLLSTTLPSYRFNVEVVSLLGTDTWIQRRGLI